MRKIVADLFVSLDGVVESPEQWTGPYFTDDIGQMIGSEMAQADTMLLGRVTYQTETGTGGCVLASAQQQATAPARTEQEQSDGNRERGRWHPHRL
jgi:hypothetical protein